MKISIENLSMTYPTGKRALQDISLKLESPNLIGLLGPNGAGKSTLMKLLVAGLLPTSGKIMLDDSPLLQDEKRLKGSLGYLPQSFGLYDELTVWQFLDYMAALKGISDSKDAIRKVIEATNLTEKRRSRIRTLSGGQRQRVGIAQALLGSPDLLIFDEPTVGLDPEERINFRNLFSQTARDKIVLLSTHIIEDVQSVCNQLIIINHGRVLFSGTPEELIALAQGHVGIIQLQAGQEVSSNHHITARVNTSQGVQCRIVSGDLPSFAQVVEPTLEDAYMYLIAGEGMEQ
ncbi:ATP-binding cassette domain-containing protein [Paenibacillus puldeungensis]|uniref:ATP-binding cassette domain-containing protein n=1 Tax=Paenibacillus puldeungensis TaxID=696536 RepID=A0ABW3S223_9BACL